MGFELMFYTPQLESAQWQQVTICLAKSTLLHPVESSRVMDSEAAAAYVFEETSRADNWPEDFYLSLEPQGLYLCFYISTGQQEEYVINLLTECLLQAGVNGKFEEL
jgi:hypothetical protein